MNTPGATCSEDEDGTEAAEGWSRTEPPPRGGRALGAACRTLASKAATRTIYLRPQRSHSLGSDPPLGAVRLLLTSPYFRFGPLTHTDEGSGSVTDSEVASLLNPRLRSPCPGLGG